MKNKLILASDSPRRVELLKSAFINFDAKSHKFDENSITIKNPYEFARELSYRKALSITGENLDSYILGVDTIVVHNNRILGKPDSAESAKQTIAELSGNNHEVISGISIVNLSKNIEFKEYSVSKVKFKKLTKEFIKFYLQNNHWNGYAGGYAIQGIFSLVVDKIEGSYSNIVGLPMEKLYEMIIKLGLDVFN